MKKLLIVSACIAALGSGLAFAQNEERGHHGKHGERPSKEERMERMREHLELSDAQVEEIRAIREAGGGREEVREVLTEEHLVGVYRCPVRVIPHPDLGNPLILPIGAETAG